MRDLTKLVAECRADLLSLGYKPCENIEWRIDSRAKKRWGQCRYTASLKACVILISNRLLQDDVDDQAAKDTIMHELIHTVRDKNGKPASKHTGLWKQIAEDVNTRLPQYTIKRTTSCTEKGVEPAKLSQVNYILRCEHCGMEIHRERMSKVISHPEKYRCGNCGFKLVRIQ